MKKNKNQDKKTLTLNQKLKYEVVRIYMSKDIKQAIKLCGSYINSKKDEILLSKELKRPINEELDSIINDFFELMFDMFQVINDKVSFINISKTYSELTNKIPPEWIEKPDDYHEYISTISNKNFLILNGPVIINKNNSEEEFEDKENDNSIKEDLEQKNNEIIDENWEIKIDNFVKNCFGNKPVFGRLNLSKLNIKKSNAEGLKKILETLYMFKNYPNKPNIIIMGDNNITEFKVNVKDEDKEKNEIIDLLKLEIYQWKGQEKKYFESSIDFLKKYSKMPPEYSKNNEIQLINSKNEKDNSNSIVTIEISEDSGIEKLIYQVKEINPQNLNYLIDHVQNYKFPIIDLDNVDYFTYDAAVELMVFLNKNQFKYKPNFIKVNKMIKVIMEMVGLFNKNDVDKNFISIKNDNS